MKKIVLKLAVPAALVALAVLIGIGCSNPAGGGGSSGVAVSGVSLDQTTLTLGVASGTETLTATITPEDATNKNVSWESDHEDIATVNDEGEVSAVAVGTAIITVTTEDGGYTATCTVTVAEYGISLDQSGTYTFQEAIAGYAAQTPVTITVSNTGDQATGALAAALSGANENDFTLSTPTISSIDVGDDDSFTVVPNTALAAGTYTATVTVSGDNDISSTFDVSFTVEAAVYDISLDQTEPLPFPAVTVGYAGTPAAATITVTNEGNVPTGPLTVALTGDNAGSFTLSKTAIDSIAAGGNDSFTVGPKPALAAGTYTATVTVSGGNDISASFNVSFTVEAAIYAIGLSQTEPLIFPAVTVGYVGTPAAATITVTNTGNLPTGPLTVALTGANDTSFTLSKTAIDSIAAGGNDTFTVVPKTALAAGTYTATVTVSGGNGISADFEVSFTVTAYAIGLSQSGTYTFTAALVGYGTQTPVTITVTNSTGNQPTGPLTAALTGANAGSFTLSKTAIDSIAAGGNDSFTVGPKTGLGAGTYTATVTVSGGNGISATFDVSFTVEPVYTIKGTITSNMPAGPAAGASVQLKKDGLDTGSAVNTAGDGSYTISGVEAGNYTIEVTLAGYTAGTISPVSVAGDVTGKDLKLLKTYNGAFFVKPSAAGDGSGSSWANASDDIQAMIAISDDYPGINEIWAAAGTYTPAHVPPIASPTTDRDRTFLLKAGVKLYGGFAGTEAALSQRNPAANVSVLSGDFDSDDGGNAMDGFTGMDENAYHVVLGVNIPDDGETVLDGFTISGGNADTNSFIPVDGKAIYRDYGGGMFNSGSSPVLTNVTISGNQATDWGGGMYNSTSSPVLTNVTISGNKAVAGGGMDNSTSSPVLTNVTISGNQANNFGGGMFNQNSSSPKIRNSIIWGNGTNNVINSGGTPSYTYSLVEALNPSGSEDGGGNLDGTSAGNNPLFADPRLPALSTEGDYRLQAGSPVIDAGSNSFYTAGQDPDLSAITTDRDGNGRFNGAAADMGAYESQ
ncbi:MAG: choice-of-anchor D domain-containing protein [Spirochaetaceae bacterium]|jgi:uncharacterized membrane protein|nr:choice-of-anchor D domain-containing protein [Spirochaetaceae bacterium]